MLQIDRRYFYIDEMNISDADLNLLTVFEALMAERSVSRAAARLGIGQPSASHALSRLRLLFRDDLLRREGRSMVPTPRALLLADPIGRALAAAREAITPPQEFHPLTSNRVFRVSGGDYALSTRLPGLMARLRRSAPSVDLRFRFVEKDRLPALLDDGTLDLALGVFPNAPKRCEVIAVCDEYFVCLLRAGHPALADGLSVVSYAAAPHVLVTERGDEFGAVDEVLGRRALARRIALTVPSVLVLLRLLRESDLICTLGARAAAMLAEDPALVVARLPVDVPAWRLQVLRARRVDAGVDWLVAEILAGNDG